MKKTVKKRFLATIALFTVLATGFQNILPAEAALTAVGPIGDPVNNGFPLWFADENGLKLELCLDQNPAGLCILTPQFDPATPGFTPIGTVASGNFPDESFYAIADADPSPANVRLPGANTDIKVTYRAALEQAFLAGITPGTQAIFLRVQADLNGLEPNTTYVVDHPYGTMNVTTDATGGGRGRLEDLVQCNAGFACNFAPILPATNTQVGSFLQWDNTLPAPPAGFVGDPNVLHTVSGGRGGINSVTVTGTNAGGVGVGSITTNLFNVSGKIFAPSIAINPQTAFTATPTITGTVADPTVTVAVTVGTDPLNANLPATVDPATGVWTVAVPTALANGRHNVTVVTGAGTANENTTTGTGVLSINPTASTVFRFWSAAKQGHFFTTSVAEKDNLIANDPSWTFEGNAYSSFDTQEPGTTPVYRFWSQQKQHHFFTVSETEKNNIIANDPSWAFEGTAFNAFPTQQAGTSAVHRFWSAAKQGHFFTISEPEKDNLIANDPSWAYEGIAYYVPSAI